MSARSGLVRMLPCLACELEGVQQPSATESHHQNLDQHAGQKRLGDDHQVPLCGWHHRGEPPRNVSKSQATFIFGPSLALDSVQFRACYGSDWQQLEQTNAKLDRLLPATA